MWGTLKIHCEVSRDGYTNKDKVYVTRAKVAIMGDSESIACSPEIFAKIPEGPPVSAVAEVTVVRKRAYKDSAPAFALGALVGLSAPPK